jgi:solute carrier family 7 (cationic amino acid transporter), member 2
MSNGCHNEKLNSFRWIKDTDLSFTYRKKRVDTDHIGDTKLNRILNTFDLTALGVGSTLGAGVYVLTGSVLNYVAGPSIIISFLIAAVSSILSGLCYAEFGARVPKTGSAYVYTYVTVGELLAFIIGWNLILEYIIGAASVAKAFSTYFDSLVEHKMSTFLRHNLPLNTSGLGEYPDIFAFGLTVLITVILAIGVKESSRINNIFTGINLCVITFVIVAGSTKASFKNWSINKEEVKP